MAPSGQSEHYAPKAPQTSCGERVRHPEQVNASSVQTKAVHETL